MRIWTVLHAVIVMGCLAFGAGFGARAQEVAQQLRLAPGDIEFPVPAGGQTGTSGVGALQVKVLSGDPRKPGLYTLVIKAGPNITIKPHAHPDNRVSVVVAGTFYFAYGDEFDESKLKRTARTARVRPILYRRSSIVDQFTRLSVSSPGRPTATR